MSRAAPFLTAALATALLAAGPPCANAGPIAARGPAAVRDATPGNPPDPSIADGSAARRLHTARRRWARHGASDYTFRVRLACFCAPRPPGQITVRRGRPVSPPAAYAAYATIPRLFAFVATAIRRQDHRLTVRYDARTGAPRTISVDPNAMIADEELGIVADHLVLRRPR